MAERIEFTGDSGNAFASVKAVQAAFDSIQGKHVNVLVPNADAARRLLACDWLQGEQRQRVQDILDRFEAPDDAA